MLCPDKKTWDDLREKNQNIGTCRFDPTGKDIITITRKNGSITLRLSYYLKLSEAMRKKLHKAWEST